jgi:LacI family transcriptional regulator
VVLDNKKGACDVVSQLIASGHRRIGYVGGTPSLSDREPRLAGYRKALADAGIDFELELVKLDNHDKSSARRAAGELLTRNHPPTAVFTDNNRMTVGVLEAIYRGGMHTEVAGFDDVELAEMLQVPVTLVTYDAADIGRQAAELLFARIAGDTSPPRRVVIPTTVVRYD